MLLDPAEFLFVAKRFRFVFSSGDGSDSYDIDDVVFPSTKAKDIMDSVLRISNSPPSRILKAEANCFFFQRRHLTSQPDDGNTQSDSTVRYSS